MKCCVCLHFFAPMPALERRNDHAKACRLRGNRYLITAQTHALCRQKSPTLHSPTADLHRPCCTTGAAIAKHTRREHTAEPPPERAKSRETDKQESGQRRPFLVVCDVFIKDVKYRRLLLQCSSEKRIFALSS